jgi:CheY-like chemotaxis protein
MTTPKRQKRVLLVCDEVVESKIISSLLQKAGLHVMSVPGRAASLDALVRAGEPIDLAIIDAGKPSIHDAVFLQSLHESYPQIRLVFLSENGADVGPAGHVRGYLHKPVRKAQLLGTILAVMDAPSVFAA